MDDESSNITYFDSSFLLNSITTPENKYAPRIQRKRNLYKGTQRVKRVRAALWTRSNGRGSSPFASFNPLSVVWKNSDEGLRLVANRRGWNGTDTSRNVRPPTHPPTLHRAFTTRRVEGVGQTRDVATRADVITASTSQPTPTAGGNPWRHQRSIRSEFL